ncbi:MAG: hypothetical protein IBGAMO2_750011 [Arenicellales bacterium IbO2]|nr:MAG: hypothetical protein IBGAMO2_750011 [Arenicellales bacterium IbO2]
MRDESYSFIWQPKVLMWSLGIGGRALARGRRSPGERFFAANYNGIL